MHQSPTFDVAAFDNPFKKPVLSAPMPEGLTICEIIDRAEIDPRHFLNLQVTISMGKRSSVVPMSSWHVIRPRAGAHIQILPILHGPAVVPLLTTIIAAAAPTIAGALFPTLAAGSFGLALATAGVSVVGALLVRALIPPPSLSRGGRSRADDTVFNITGASNGAKPYEVYPTVLGRHIMFPVKTATGFTETVDGDIYLRERMTFGYGPVAISELKIGTTPITEFEDVEIEFLNVDQTRTLAAIPDLVGGNVRVVGWRLGTQRLSLYPDDIVEDTYSVGLEADEPVVRTTRTATTSSSVDISFQGLVRYNDEGQKRDRSVDIDIEYRLVGDPDWTVHETLTCTENTTAYVRFTSVIEFPAEGEYDIRVTRTTADSDDTAITDIASLTAIRSIQSGLLPSHADIAEIAVRIKASNELNGQIQNLNAVVQQLAPVYNGTTWSAPEPVRHPAWLYARALMGPYLRDAVTEDRIDVDGLLAWATEEPHWTCDAVIDTATRLSEVLDLICACGRGKRGLADLKYSVIRDGGAGGVVQHFSPRNSWGFTGKRYLDRDIHAFKVKVVSEKKEWASDEVLVYADGYNAGNATEIETLDLPGVVLDEDGTNQGNAYRLGRYHLAVAKLRPEEFSFYSDLDHIPCQRGDKVTFVHDVPKFGVGAGRVKSATTTTIVLDEYNEVDEAASYRLRIRSADGSQTIVTATHVSGGSWTVDPAMAEAPEVDDLVLIEQTEIETVELLITSITHMGELQAKITALPAAPAVLTADTGTIPDYDPQITRNSSGRIANPTVIQTFTGAAAASGNDVRIGVEIANPSYTNVTTSYHQLRWRLSGLTKWTQPVDGLSGTVLFTGPLVESADYEIEVRAVAINGDFSNWVSVGDPVTATLSFDVPFDVRDFDVSILNGYATFTWRSIDPTPVVFHIKYSATETRWENAVDVNNNISGQSFSMPAVNGNFLIKAVAPTGLRSFNAQLVTVSSAEAVRTVTIQTVTEEGPFGGTAGDNVTILTSTIVFQNYETDPDLAVPLATGTYDFENTLDLVNVNLVRLAPFVDLVAVGISPQLFDIVDIFTVGDLFGDPAQDWTVRIEEQHTTDDPADMGAVWTSWAPLSFGNYLARGFRFRVFFRAGLFGTTLSVAEATVRVDVAERVEFDNDVTALSGGTSVTFTDPFYAVPAVVIDGEGLPTGAIQSRTVTETGFTVSYTDSGGSPITATFDWHAVGIGKVGI